MSEENYEFANYMQLVPTYKYLDVLAPIVFDPKVQKTQRDNWNYYGEYIRHWYPALLDLLNLAGVTLNAAAKKLAYVEEDEPASGDFLGSPFNDPFLDYMRKEVNEAFAASLYLSVMFLSRKILEASVVRIFEVVFPKLKGGNYDEANHDLWYDKSKNKYHSFDLLLDNLKENAAAFHEDKALILEAVSLIKPFKNETNACVHSDYKIPDEAALKAWKIPHLVSLVRKLFKKYCNP